MLLLSSSNGRVLACGRHAAALLRDDGAADAIVGLGFAELIGRDLGLAMTQPGELRRICIQVASRDVLLSVERRSEGVVAVHCGQVAAVAQRQTLRQQLEQALRHDQRAVLTILMGALATIDEDAEMPAEDQVAFVQMALREAQRLERFVDARDALARMDVVDTVPRPVPLGIEVHAAVDRSREPTRVTVDVASDGRSASAVAAACPSLVATLFDNLLSEFFVRAASDAPLAIRIRGTDEGTVVVRFAGELVRAFRPEDRVIAQTPPASAKRDHIFAVGLPLVAMIADYLGWRIALGDAWVELTLWSHGPRS